MRNPAVHWSEGMFLRPHHFQAADRYWTDLVSAHQHFDHPNGYGVHRISISAEALAAGLLEVSGIQARWKDGTVIVQDDTHVERVDLNVRLDPAAANGPITVYLAIPNLQEGQANVAVGKEGGFERFVEFRRQSDDESLGGNRQEIAFRKLNCRILLSTEETSGFGLLPIAQLARSASGDGLLRIDSNYYPPSTTMQAWPELAGTFRAIHDVLGSRMQSLSDQIRDKGITLSSSSQGDLEKLLLLHAVNESYGELSCLAFAAGVHPLVAYATLCRIIGRFALFGPEMTVDAVPKYDHDDLAPIFKFSLERIRKLIFSVKEDEYEQRYFVGAGRGMMVNLEPEWFGPDWDWYFAVDPVTLKPEECLQLLKHHIDWKLGSADKIEQLFQNMAPGITLRPVAQAPRALPSRGNWVFFQITRENDAWKHVQITQTIAMRVRTEQIANLDSLEGARRLRLLVKGAVYGLEFCIFAVRKRV